MTVHHLPLRSTLHIPPREDRDWVTSSELINDTGISYRQLDYWCLTGLLTALPEPGRRGSKSAETPGSGHPRRFHHDQVAEVRTIRALLDAGISLQTIRRHLDELLETHRVDIGAVTITIRDPAGETA